MRYELNNNSEIVEYKGSVQSLSDKKAILESLFSQGTYECTSISNSGCEWSIEYKNSITKDIKKITIYYGNIRNEDRNNKEKKIQLNGKDPRSNSAQSIILGAYCYDSQDSLENIVFAGWNIDPNTNYPGNPSLRGLNIDNIQEARFNGLYKNKFKNNYVCTFRPEFIFYYIENIQSIHNSSEDFIVPSIDSSSQDVNNVIYYGSPGTGKSHKADEKTNGKAVHKVTFHPEYDYHSFIGGYKPTMDGDKIVYKFVPQIFTKTYVKAWKNLVSDDETQPFYLQIEEINRGNCAEIFGGLFQLLDRDNNGFSKYKVTAEEELRKYLLSDDGFGGEHKGIKEGKLHFPSNLKIIATMNTSDQSLFPMDSAFKRRWDWEYVPIDYNCKKSDFTIKLNNGKEFKWLDFLKKVNKEIFEITKSQDKQIGNWFINAQNSKEVITEDTFVNKVIFYLWNDVFKDEENTIFKLAEDENLTYSSFFEKEAPINLLSDMLEKRLDLIDLNQSEESTTDEE
ncbi:MAG: hypothetical protein CMC13_10560 [Flavobacteriaceae bacterium]|nr:hypothetical protein [Flavobacteriaceae bacterium]|tara:strand:+ start:4080 stop:5606 length:1527 start_codon:yes stop_codon:yes gene_type:complete